MFMQMPVGLAGLSGVPCRTPAVISALTSVQLIAVEAVFSLPGLGQLLINAAESRDIPVVQGLLLVVSAFVVVVNLVVNTLLAWLNRSADGVSA